MNYLLDTHILLWAAANSNQLPKAANDILRNKANNLYFSSANIWEVAIKQSLGKKDFLVDARVLRRGLLDNGYYELPITSEHAVITESLPNIHKDPFDRILIAQAMTEGFKLLTADSKIVQYPGPIQIV